MTKPRGKNIAAVRERADSPAAYDVTPLADLDTQLMLQARNGNRDAADALVRRNSDRIARYLARLVGPRRPVEDLTQDVFLQALAHADQYRPNARVTTWLYRIATNTALNYLKQAAVRRRSPDLPEHVDSATPSPERKLGLDELRQQVSQAIAELPLKQRIALTLLQFEGFSYEQIATILDTTTEATRSLLLRARTALRSRLQDVL